MTVFPKRVVSSALNEPEASGSDVISVPEACEFLGVHRNTLYKLIRAGEVPAFKLMSGGRWKFRRSALEQWLEDRQGRGLQ